MTGTAHADSPDTQPPTMRRFMHMQGYRTPPVSQLPPGYRAVSVGETTRIYFWALQWTCSGEHNGRRVFHELERNHL
jgi:hypothetical protein